MGLATYVSLVQISAPGWSTVLVDYSLFVMQIYLTKVWGLDVTHAAGILNIWGGICLILPLFLLFLTDAYFGNFWMLVISSIASSLGIGFISISTPPVFAKFSTSTCKAYEARCISHTQKVLFYLGMALAAVGMSGNLVSAEKLLNEQINEETRKSKRLRITRFILVALPHVIGAVGLPSLNSWSLQFGIPGICTIVAMFLFFSGSCYYNTSDAPKGSALTTVCRVFVAAARNRSRPSDDNGKEPAGFTKTQVSHDEAPRDEKKLHDENDKELVGFAHNRVTSDEIPPDEKNLHDDNDKELTGFADTRVPGSEIPPDEKNLRDDNDKELMGFAHTPVPPDESPSDEKNMHDDNKKETMGFAHTRVPASEIPPDEKNLHDDNEKETMGFSHTHVSPDEIPLDEKILHDDDDKEPTEFIHTRVPSNEIPPDEKNLHDDNDEELMGFANTPVPPDEIPPDEKNLHDDNEKETMGFAHTRVSPDEIPLDEKILYDDDDKEPTEFIHTRVPSSEIPPDEKNLHDDNDDDKELMGFANTSVPPDEIPPDEKNLHDDNEKETMGFAHTRVPPDEIPIDGKILHDDNDKEPTEFIHTQVPSSEIPPDEKNLYDDNDKESAGSTHTRVQPDDKNLHDDNDKESMGLTHTRIPPDEEKLHDDNHNETTVFSDTRCLRCLEKAVPMESSKQVKGRWRVCTISEVEEAKIAVRMVPMWLTFIVIGVVTSTANTYFVEQASNMKIEKIGNWSIPLPTFLLFFHQAKLMFMFLYKNFIKKSLERYASPAGVGLAMILSVLCCLTAATIEKWRRSQVNTTSDISQAASSSAAAPAPSSSDDGPSISALWLVFQFLLLAGVEELSERGISEFFGEQAPESMKVYLNNITMGLTGLGFMLGVALIRAAGGEDQTRKHWQRTNLDGLRLDKYYWLLAILSSANLTVYSFVAYFYRYKPPQTAPESSAAVAPSAGEWINSCFSC